jgi:Bacterial Ig domain
VITEISFSNGGAMGMPRVAAILGALAVVSAVGVLPAQVAGAQSPSTTVTIPTNNSTVSGTSQLLDAAASSGASQVRYEITGGSRTDSVVATATPTYYGWLALWNTTTVANGSYNLQSVASFAGGVNVTSPAVAITVNNAPPSTIMLLPANGSTMDTTNSVAWDAVASPGVTTVTFVATPTAPGFVPETIPATPTIFGWVAIISTGGPPCSGCVPISVPLSIQSVAAYSGGTSGTSQPVNATLIIHVPDVGL